MANQQQVPSSVIRLVCDSIIDNLGEKSLRLLFNQSGLQKYYSGGELPPAPAAEMDTTFSSESARTRTSPAGPTTTSSTISSSVMLTFSSGSITPARACRTSSGDGAGPASGRWTGAPGSLGSGCIVMVIPKKQYRS